MLIITGMLIGVLRGARCGALGQFRMDVVSNQPIQESEFLRWTRSLAQEAIALPTKAEIDELEAKLARANEFRYTAEEVKLLVEEKRKAGQSTVSGASER
eukprot:5636884-Pyramimonas_sp.AAC.1